jgi:hypothetical protein
MKAGILRSRPFWQTSESRPVRPELWLLAVSVIGILLIEVWQSSRVAELSLGLDRTRSALTETRAHVDYMRAEGERRITRAELAPVARQLGLAPAQVHQVVALPSAYLAEARPAERRTRTPSLWTWAERASRALVPEATARGRTGD